MVVVVEQVAVVVKWVVVGSKQMVVLKKWAVMVLELFGQFGPILCVCRHHRSHTCRLVVNSFLVMQK